jgi:predicted RNA-binding Zn ribbon-like protein
MIRTSWPCLTLTQTRGWEARDRSDDRFQDYAAVVAWARERGLVQTGEADVLLAEAARRSDDAAEVLAHVVRARALLYRIFSGVARGDPPATEDVADLNRLTAAVAAHRTLTPARGPWNWRWDDDPKALDRVLWPVLESAVELLTSDLLPRVKLCQGDGCGWLFVDASRNRSRRWCDMSDCGNLAKVRRYRQRRADNA